MSLRGNRFLHHLVAYYIIGRRRPCDILFAMEALQGPPEDRSEREQSQQQAGGQHTRSVIDFKVRHGVISCLHGRRRASQPASRPASCLNTRHRAGRVVADDDQRVRPRHVPAVHPSAVLRISSACQHVQEGKRYVAKEGDGGGAKEGSLLAACATRASEDGCVREKSPPSSSSSFLCVVFSRSCKNSVVVAQEESLSSLLVVGEQDGEEVCLSRGRRARWRTALPGQGRTGEDSDGIWGIPPRARFVALCGFVDRRWVESFQCGLAPAWYCWNHVPIDLFLIFPFVFIELTPRWYCRVYWFDNCDWLSIFLDDMKCSLTTKRGKLLDLEHVWHCTVALDKC